MNKKQKEAMIAYGLKIAGLEEIVRRHKICIDAHNTRLADHDESIEALDETAVQLSVCKCQAGELLKRIEKLELEVVRADTFRQNHIDRIVRLENANIGLRLDIDEHVETLQKEVKALKSANMGRTNALLEQTQRVDKLFAWIERLNGSVDQIIENRRAVPKRQGEIKPRVFLKGTMSGSGGGVQTPKPGRPRKGVK